MISLKAQGIKALIPSALVSEGPRSKGLMAAILLWRRLGAVAKARFDTHHLEEYAQTSAALEKATSALAQLEGELSRRSETASAHLVNNSVATKMKHFPLEGVVISPMKSRAQV
ncbi:hypothetical protein L1987_88958 [Smallanthus sonchifolius]|nr:hypothetical protein L1987_88958 [Smallanthus sonchifolius]